MKKASELTRICVAVFLTVAAILLFYDTLMGRAMVLTMVGQFLDIAAPVFYGIGFTYLLAPVVDFFERIVFGAIGTPRRSKIPGTITRGTALVMTWLSICLFFYWILAAVLPEIYNSLMQLLSNVESYYYTLESWIEQLFEFNPQVEAWVSAQMDEYYVMATNWISQGLLPRAQSLVGVVSGSVVGIYVFAQNIFMGVIVSIYMLATKEKLGAHGRKLIYGMFDKEQLYWVIRGIRRVDGIFSGFIRGKILDSFVVGVLAFFCCTLLGFPYVPLLSVIIGVTNIIPFFGPFIGGIPCFFLVLLVSPVQALYFALFIFALQQLDGNVIGPLLLGDKTGLPGFVVIAAILIGGGLFGVLGMFFGVPVAAAVYSGLRFWLECRLEKRNLPVDTAAYTRQTCRVPEPEEPMKTEKSGD